MARMKSVSRSVLKKIKIRKHPTSSKKGGEDQGGEFLQYLDEADSGEGDDQYYEEDANSGVPNEYSDRDNMEQDDKLEAREMELGSDRDPSEDESNNIEDEEQEEISSEAELQTRRGFRIQIPGPTRLSRIRGLQN